MPTRVLVIDDDENTPALMEAILELSGYEVSTVADGAHGLAMAAANPPDVVDGALRVQINLPTYAKPWSACPGVVDRPLKTPGDVGTR